MNPTKKGKIIIGLKKSQSLIGQIISMVEKENYCIDIMNQNMAVIGLLKSVHKNLMENHLNSCFRNAMASKRESKKQKMIKEILQVSKLFNK